MKDAGVFGMATPLTWGGPELDPLTQFRVIEALATADGSVGWCAMINCDSRYVTAFLDRILDAHCTQTSSAHRRRRVHNRPSNPCARRKTRTTYAFPFMFITKGSAPALGDARHAIDAVDTASRKPARLYTLGERLEAPKTMRDDVFVQEAVGRAETMLASARAYQFELIGDLWSTLSSGGEPTPQQIALVTTGANHVIGVGLEVVRLVCKVAAGAAAIKQGRLTAACAIF